MAWLNRALNVRGEEGSTSRSRNKSPLKTFSLIFESTSFAGVLKDWSSDAIVVLRLFSDELSLLLNIAFRYSRGWFHFIFASSYEENPQALHVEIMPLGIATTVGVARV